MKRLSLFLIFSGILILVYTTLISANIYNEVLNMNGFYALNKAEITVKNKVPNVMFSLSDIDKLKDELGTNEIGYSASSDTYVKYGSRYYQTKITGVNHSYFNFTDCNIIEGSFFTGNDVEESKSVILIDSRLAWNIFNSVDIVGKELELYGKTFRIVGVYEKYGILDDKTNQNTIETLTFDGISNVYIPIETFMDINADATINIVHVKTKENSTLGTVEDEINSALESIGKTPLNYEVTDYNTNSALLNQKPRIIIFILALIILLIIITYIKQEIIKGYRIVKQEIKNSYLKEAVIRSLYQLIVPIAKVTVCIIAVVIILYSAKFKLYIPSEYLPEELIDIEYYTDLFESKRQELNQNINIEKSYNLMEYEMADKLTNFLLMLGIFGGVPLLFIGINQMKYNQSMLKTILFSAAFLIISVVSAIPVLVKLGFPHVFEIKSLIVIWVCAFTSVLYFFHKRKRFLLEEEY